MEHRWGVPVIDPRVRVIPRSALDALPAEIVGESNVLPISLSGGVLTVAVEDPLDFELLDRLRFLSGLPIEPVAADGDHIRAVVRWHYGQQD